MQQPPNLLKDKQAKSFSKNGKLNLALIFLGYIPASVYGTYLM